MLAISRKLLETIFVIYFIVISVNCWSENNEKIVIKVSHNGSDQHPHQAGYEKISEILEIGTKECLRIYKKLYQNKLIKISK